ncbi:Protein phosphatase 2C [Cordyceps fumosorosea ARSEF 2679]|uniref:Protein phosphatase 2C n=1 Tax=Cordyceps fumosorosea (strain ARSEF 2679) TaxID=1081104 RepID=A0A167Q2Y6_CORFA|nr:Protein phosphatase 2C [Cordyceps fumosorosea ARSEF 2679]OAA57234.1 Protein phosphatase 2C [Cordyceps fumosorosea ARSEF 2679]
MFGGSSSNSNSIDSSIQTDTASDRKPPSPNAAAPQPIAAPATKSTDQAASGEKRHTNGSPPTRQENGGSTDKKRRSSSVSSKASSLFASARSSFGFSPSSRHSPSMASPLQKLGKQDPALAVPQGSQNNSAGDSVPGPRSTFRVGVWEDRNRKCRRTMEDTHAFLYNFLDANALDGAASSKSDKSSIDTSSTEIAESDNGYFAIFDGHAGTFAADWCGKKLHIVLEDIVRKNPHAPLPELLDQTFTSCDAQLEKLPLKNSGCTAAIAVLRWEKRSASDRHHVAVPTIAMPTVKNGKLPESNSDMEKANPADKEASATTPSKPQPNKQRVLYTANVGDARIILCRNGKALRLSYDHKGSDENEGKRIANAGGLILNNRVNGVLAVTRALGDAYMKELVTGHPYTTETVIQPELDEFIIIACDGLWDVCGDQEAVDLIREMQDPTAASKALVEHALDCLSTDNLSCMVIRLDQDAIRQASKPGAEPVGGRTTTEADKIVGETKQKIADGSTAPIGVSTTNSGRGCDAASASTPGRAADNEEVAVVDDDEDAEVTRAGEDTPVEEKPARGGTVL